MKKAAATKKKKNPTLHADTPLVEVNQAIIGLVVQTKNRNAKTETHVRMNERNEPQSEVPSVALAKKISR